MAKMVTVAFRLPEKLIKRVDKLARKLDRSRSWIIRKAIIEGLKNRRVT